MIAAFEAPQRERGLTLRWAFMHFSSNKISRPIAVAPFILVVVFAAVNLGASAN